MARMEDLVETEQEHMRSLALNTFDTTPWAEGPPLSERRVAIVTTAGLSLRDEAAFGLGAADYRVIPAAADTADILMNHVSVNFDRTGFQDDVNIVFPIDRLREMAADGEIGSVADFHYSFMGATDPALLEDSARALAGMLREDQVNAVILTPV
ncbi:MAG: selenoprotein B glycine/betaine/sarcosine/D-proline reductase [Alphaproteobacteria bacterium]|nr:selenoprotein B glycine/betaine/sarcosine/D-proline reductase [Alphaproteobacteria bacterium]